jgi:NADP-dependent aldehyde dehydrogenase
MSLHGKNLIAGVLSAHGSHPFHAINPAGGAVLEPAFCETTLEEVDLALAGAEGAYTAFRRSSAEQRARLLERIADGILALGDALLERARAESGLPLDRLTGERGRTVGQLRQFAEVLREGSWCDIRIDTALPERTPLPRPDLRRVLVPIGPVVVFGASNFPLAFSVAGGDTASALAAGCPVVVKGHPAHPGTSELVATAVSQAVAEAGLPAGVFSLLQGSRTEFAIALVKHPLTSAVGFTGSHRGGRALLDAANSRRDPIPVFAEMSSLNPVFLMPGALRERGESIVQGLKTSITAGMGQFCTKPGLVFGIRGAEWEQLSNSLGQAIASTTPASMLHAGICSAYQSGLDALAKVDAVRCVGRSATAARAEYSEPQATLWATSGEVFLREPLLREEVFGPSSLLVEAADADELLSVARVLGGQLTATVHGTAADFAGAGPLLEILERKAGRVIVNGYPTGVEVCPAMHHGGPYPATTDVRFTSVGTASIQRWLRPVCYQNFPETVLPRELWNDNPEGRMRRVNGRLSTEAL